MRVGGIHYHMRRSPRWGVCLAMHRKSCLKPLQWHSNHVLLNHVLLNLLWRRNDWYKTFPLTWSPSGRTSSFAMAICHHVIKKSNEKRILLKGKQLFSSRSHPKRSPTQNHFHQDRPHRKMIDKSNAKRILLKENSHFHQDRPHRKVSKKVQRKTRFT